MLLAYVPAYELVNHGLLLFKSASVEKDMLLKKNQNLVFCVLPDQDKVVIIRNASSLLLCSTIFSQMVRLIRHSVRFSSCSSASGKVSFRVP